MSGRTPTEQKRARRTGTKFAVEFKDTDTPLFARIVIDGTHARIDTPIQIGQARDLLCKICSRWPAGMSVKCISTCGGFLSFDWPNELADVGEIGDFWNPDKRALTRLQQSSAQVVARVL